jgi:hypothetical protein
MDATDKVAMTPAGQAFFIAMEERLRQLRRRRGVPNGVPLVDAVALHMVSADEVEQARWGADGPPPDTTSTPVVQAPS